MHKIAFAAAFLACFAYVFIVGGRPERTAMMAQLAALLLSLFANSFRSIPFTALPAGLAIVDLALAAALTLLALKANRLWPIVLAGMQVATILAHLAKAIAFPLPASGYGIFVQFWAWPMLVVTALGAHRHHERIRKFGAERDWKPLWPRSVPAGSTA